MSNYQDVKVVLITGALSDIGRATAEAFALAGYSIVLNYRHQAERANAFADSLIQECKAPHAIAIPADIRSQAEVHAMFEQAYQALGRVDVLVNNAGINLDRPFLEMGVEDWNTVISTILSGNFYCSQEFSKRYAGEDGNIINIGAVTAINGRKNGANYCSARAAVLMLTKCLALELAPRIRVNTVTPGRIDTEEVQTRYHLDIVSNREKFVEGVPLKRLGKPEEVAKMITFLTTKDCYITGQNFFVDGGLFMR